MDKGSRNAGVYRGLPRSASCTPERSTTPTRPLGYIAQLGILSYKGGYKDKEEEALIARSHASLITSFQPPLGPCITFTLCTSTLE